MKKRALCLRVVPLLLAATAISHASTVLIDSTLSGCVQCTSIANVVPGDVVSFTGYTLVQLTLGAGTYTITDAATTGYYSAWNSSYPVNPWYWAFGAANDATGAVLLDDYVGTSSLTAAPFTTQALAAGATGIKTYDGTTLLSATTTASFSDTLILGSSTTVDFYVIDKSVSDNYGGISLNVTLNQTGVPEPASFLLVGTVLLAAGCLRLRRRAG